MTILFKCNRCKYKQEVSEKNCFKRCPKCRETLFLNYYENHYISENNVLKGGEENMVTKKKTATKTTAIKKTSETKVSVLTNDEIIEKSTKVIDYINNVLKISDASEKKRILGKSYRIVDGK